MELLRNFPNWSDRKSGKDQPFLNQRNQLLVWIEFIFTILCAVILLYLFFGKPDAINYRNEYLFLVSLVLVLMLLALNTYRRGKYILSARLLILSSCNWSVGIIFFR